jgi:hypothetical protein
MKGEKVIEILFGIALVVIVAFFTAMFLFVIFPPRVHFETKASTTCTIPATEWKCQINVDTNEITCKGVIK